MKKKLSLGVIFFCLLIALSMFVFTAKSDAARVLSSQGTKNFEVAGWQARSFAESRGFFFGKIWNSTGSECKIENQNGIIKMEAVGGTIIGSKCDFKLFGGKSLAPGWSFVTFDTGLVNYNSEKYGASFTKQPSRGSNNIEFIIRVWADRGKTNGRKNVGRMWIRTITLNGPANANSAEDAFK